jgi:hypothetical protein
MKLSKLVVVLFFAAMILALGLLVASLSGCADLSKSLVPPTGPTFRANGSLQYPYPVTVSKGPCKVWSIVYGNDEGNPLCAQTLPTQQIGSYVQLSYEGTPAETVCLVSIDARKQVARVQ